MSEHDGAANASGQRGAGRVGRRLGLHVVDRDGHLVAQQSLAEQLARIPHEGHLVDVALHAARSNRQRLVRLRPARPGRSFLSSHRARYSKQISGG